MDISGVSSTILLHMLRITQNKSCSRVLFKAGAPSEYGLLIISGMGDANQNCIRCTAPSNNLDHGVDVISRTQHYTESLVDLLDSQTLWTDYGIDDDIIVHFYSNLEFSTVESCHYVY